MTRRLGSDTALAVVIITFALVVAFGLTPFISEEWREAAEARYYVVGPKMFPRLAAALLVLLSLLLIAAGRGGERERPADAGLSPEGRRSVATTVLFSVGYIGVLPHLGFLAATVLALLAFLICFGERRWYVVLPIVVLGPSFIHYSFATWIQVPLPEGLLEGLLPF